MNRFELPSSKLPWHNDYPLTPVDVSAIIAADLPSLRDAPVVMLGEGWDFTTFLVDDEWVFRFPKRRQSARQMARERAILEALAARLSDQPVAIPRYQHYITNPARFALPYGAYRMLLGTALLHRPAHATNALDIAAQLGRFLNALSDAAPLDPPRVYHDDFPANLMEFRRELDEVAAALPEHLRVACTTLLARPIVPMSAQPVFQHGDLGVEHILIDAVHPRVNAIIDWGDAGWGGSGDLAGLWAWGGDAPVTVALSEAGRPLSQEGWARLRLHGAAYAIGSAHYGYKDRRDPLFATALGWLERMYANGQLSDPETPDV